MPDHLLYRPARNEPRDNGLILLSENIVNFSSMGLSAHILQAVAAYGYDEPTVVQAQAIPAVLEGHDVMAAAQTGTGKTAGFTLPILER